MKVTAFNDRGKGDIRDSHDIEDVLSLIASRPTIVEDVASADAAVRSRVDRFASNFLATGLAEELVTGHLRNAHHLAEAVRVTLKRLGELATLV